jgi:malate dehydrogenase (oxaloacetate-decarboxylating)
MKYRITAEGVLETGLSGFDLINFPMLNKGTAFTEDERTDFALHGLLPPHVGNLEDQAARRLKALRRMPTLQRDLAQAARTISQLSQPA